MKKFRSFKYNKTYSLDFYLGLYHVKFFFDNIIGYFPTDSDVTCVSANEFSETKNLF